MTVDWSDPATWFVIFVVAWMVFVSVELFLIGRHVCKVDDLAYELHEDLSTAEETIDRLEKQKADRVAGRRLPIPAQTIADTQVYGRHAHRG